MLKKKEEYSWQSFITELYLEHMVNHLSIFIFLVGAFPLREKCPTIAVTVF